MSWHGNRRRFLATASVALTASAATPPLVARLPTQNEVAAEPQVLNPFGRVPMSFVIDDSTCLVNMGHFCTPQFAAAHPGRDEYQRPWRQWPREIPDSFVREFGEWCAANGVKGKYSIVPYPACVGWLDRELPGWSAAELRDSLNLVRELIVPNWDIHPEMITHTRVIDLQTGRPFEQVSTATMENSYPQQKKSVDELAAYLAYALRILKNCGLPCEGITTPGGFGNLVKTELSQAVGQAVRDVYSVDLPHYFKYVHSGDTTTAPILEFPDPAVRDPATLTVNVPAGTGDWFGGWQGVEALQGQRYCNDDATQGRMVELIEREQPAVMLCHWPGMYCNGNKTGFQEFQRIVTTLRQRYEKKTVWMKLSEIGRYQAARELTRMSLHDGSLKLTAPFAAAGFTLSLPGGLTAEPVLVAGDQQLPLREVRQIDHLQAGTWFREPARSIICIDLPRGESAIRMTS